MGLFRKREDTTTTTTTQTTVTAEDSSALLEAMLGKKVNVGRREAMNIPAIASCVEKISNEVAGLDVKLYRQKNGTVEEIKEDPRLKLLNCDTGDTLNPYEMKKAMVVDMLLGKGGYCYINKVGRNIKSLNYVRDIELSFQKNIDPIFKDYKMMCYGKSYEGWQFIKLLRGSDNGYEGHSIIQTSPLLMSIIYESQIYEEKLVKTGGNKKGFLETTRKLSQDAMNSLKKAFQSLYSNSSDNVVVLNEGLTFRESSSTSVEMQMNENKTANNNDICKMFMVPPSIINGGASETDLMMFREGCIIPILQAFNSAINSVLLTENEKGYYFFAFDEDALLKGDIEKRFKAYEIGCKNGFMQIDEIRAKEKLPELGLDFVKLGLQDVLYYPEDGHIYTPNTGLAADVTENTQTDNQGA